MASTYLELILYIFLGFNTSSKNSTFYEFEFICKKAQAIHLVYPSNLLTQRKHLKLLVIRGKKPERHEFKNDETYFTKDEECKASTEAKSRVADWGIKSTLA
jgi:hypothetical protein